MDEKPHAVLTYDALLAELGEQRAFRLLKHYGGHKLPKFDNARRHRRNAALWKDFNERRLPVEELRAKYNLRTKQFWNLIEALRKRYVPSAPAPAEAPMPTIERIA